MKLLICVVLCLPLCSCAGKGPPVSGEPIPQIRGAAAAVRELPNEIDGFGTLSFLSKIDIAAPQDALVKKLFFREGDPVVQGALVAVLENPQITLAAGRAENTVAQARAARELARSRLMEGEFQAEAQLLSIKKGEAELVQARRVWDEEHRKQMDRELLFEAGGVSEEAVKETRFSLASRQEQISLMERELDIRRVGCRDQDLIAAGLPVPVDEEGRFRTLVSLLTASLRAELGAAEARLDAAEKELESARIALAELRILSPGTGILGARYFEEGERVKREDKIFTLMDTGSLYAFFPVREHDAPRLKNGMAAAVRLDGTGETRQGTVDLIYPQADSQSFTFLVRVLLENSKDDMDGWKPGMFTRVQVTLGPPRQTLTVPESSLMDKKDREAKVFVVAGNTLSGRTVGLGLSLGADREIVSGLAAGEVVVVKPEGELREGTYVSVVD